MARGDIAYVDFPESEEERHEQTGRRPGILVIASTALRGNDMRMVVPLTSRLATLRFPFTFEIQPSAQNGLSIPSIALVYQLRAIDKDFIYPVIGHLEDHYMEKLDAIMRQLLGL